MAAEVDPGVTAENPARDLIDAFILSEASHHALNAANARGGPLGELSRLLGSVCAQIATNGNSRSSRAELRKAQADISEWRRPTSAFKGSLQTQIALDFCAIELGLIRLRGDEEAVVELRQDLNDTAFAWLEKGVEVIKKCSKRQRETTWGGMVTELTALALINRSGSNDFMILPALPHNEQRNGDQKYRNYDQVLIRRSAADYAEIRSTHVQVKRACAALRPGHEHERGVDQARYFSNIRILSGCCDLSLHRDPETQQLNTVLPELLLEHRSNTDSYASQYLGSRALKIVETIDDPVRAGHLTLAEAV